LARSYIGVQNGRWMFDFVQGYLCEINTHTIAYGHCTMYVVGSCGRHGISSFERLTAFVFVTQLDGIIDLCTFYNSGNNKIIIPIGTTSTLNSHFTHNLHRLKTRCLTLNRVFFIVHTWIFHVRYAVVLPRRNGCLSLTMFRAHTCHPGTVHVHSGHSYLSHRTSATRRLFDIQQ